jgi:hypothetical protein
MPEITPEEAAKLRPLGSRPEATFQVYGATPPWASRVTEYGAWTTAAGTLVVRIFSAAGVTTKSTEFLDCAIDVNSASSKVLLATEIRKVLG